MMLFYMKKSSRKIVHYSGCKYLKGSMSTTMGAFQTIEEAHAAGYRVCRCCSPIAKRFQKECAQILKFCAHEGLSCYQSDGMIAISTPRSQWKIITVGKHNKIFLYHQNTNPYHREDHASLVPGYHSQAIRKDSIIEYLLYIVEHDAFRLANPTHIPKPPKSARKGAPKGSKRWHKEQHKLTKLKRRNAIKNVVHLIDQLQAASH
ncbi:MAG: hypothetical protein VB078_03710 [Clostridiaceae bacterium]|nr:hypothetical protein [Clostridiaceae bacterium]